MPLKPPPSSESTWKRRELLWDSSGTARAACGPDASNIRPPCSSGVCAMPIRVSKSTRTTSTIVSTVPYSQLHPDGGDLMPTTEFFNVREAAKRLNIHENTVRNLEKRGKLK